MDVKQLLDEKLAVKPWASLAHLEKIIFKRALLYKSWSPKAKRLRNKESSDEEEEQQGGGKKKKILSGSQGHKQRELLGFALLFDRLTPISDKICSRQRSSSSAAKSR